MVFRILCQQRLEVGHGFAFSIFNSILPVTFDAQIERQTNQQTLHIRGMRVVTVHAFRFGLDHPMLYFRLSRQRFDIFMATIA